MNADTLTVCCLQHFLNIFFHFFFNVAWLPVPCLCGYIKLLTCLQSLFPYVTGNADKAFTWGHICVSFCTVPTATSPFLFCLHSLVYTAKYMLAWFFYYFHLSFAFWSLVLGRSHSLSFHPVFHYLVGFLLTLSIHLHVVIHPLNLMPLNTSPHNYWKYNFGIYALGTSDLEKFQTYFTFKSLTSSVHLILLIEFNWAICFNWRNLLWSFSLYFQLILNRDFLWSFCPRSYSIFRFSIMFLLLTKNKSKFAFLSASKSWRG